MSLGKFSGIWRGQTIVCLASGPSLTPGDIELVRQSGLKTVVVNNTWEAAPWADMLYAMDALWWNHYGDRAVAEFKGHKFSFIRCGRPGVISTKGEIFPTGWGNSGSYALSLGVVTGASRIIALGYDGQIKPGQQAHWHPDHPKPLGNCHSVKSWPYRFQLVANYAKSHGVRVVNCSRETALECFELGDLRHELGVAEC